MIEASKIQIEALSRSPFKDSKEKSKFHQTSRGSFKDGVHVFLPDTNLQIMGKSCKKLEESPLSPNSQRTLMLEHESTKDISEHKKSINLFSPTIARLSTKKPLNELLGFNEIGSPLTDRHMPIVKKFNEKCYQVAWPVWPD